MHERKRNYKRMQNTAAHLTLQWYFMVIIRVTCQVSVINGSVCVCRERQSQVCSLYGLQYALHRRYGQAVSSATGRRHQAARNTAARWGEPTPNPTTHWLPLHSVLSLLWCKREARWRKRVSPAEWKPSDTECSSILCWDFPDRWTIIYPPLHTHTHWSWFEKRLVLSAKPDV